MLVGVNYAPMAPHLIRLLARRKSIASVSTKPTCVAGELTRDGVKVKLQEQPFQVLLVMLGAVRASGHPRRIAAASLARRYLC